MRIGRSAVEQNYADGANRILGSQREDAERLEALSYLSDVMNLEGNRDNWRCETVIAVRSSEGILEYSQRDDIDLIAMYVPERRGLAKLIKGNTSKRVLRDSLAEVRIFGPKDVEDAVLQEAIESTAMEPQRLVQAMESSGNGTPNTFLDRPAITINVLKEVDLFKNLSIGQIDAVGSLGERLSISKGETLGEGGQLGQNLFIIVDGEAQLSAHSSAGEISVRVAGPKESFPMATLLGAHTLITTGIALTDMDVLAIPSDNLGELCAIDAEIGRNVYKAAAQLFASRYSDTLNHLAISAERELEHQDTETDWLK